MKHFNISFKPDGTQISIHAGAILIEAAGQAGIILNSVCGGKGICKKCLVKLEPDARQVLACQYHIQSDLTVTILPSSRFFEQKILERGVDTQIDLRPNVFEKYRKKGAKNKIFGVAVDIGTTTVVAKLINMTDGQCKATQAALNPQTRYGDDVVSRIAYAQTDEKLAELHQTIIDCINELIGKLLKKTAIDAKHIYEICVVGNTAMNHIFLKLPVTQLGQAPYEAFSLDAHDVPADELALQMNPAGNIHTVENIAGFVGSDTSAVALATGIDSAEDLTLVIDIGTNGELILGTGDKLYAASCAAGPALEGARITCGSRAAEGAIEAVVVNEDDIELDVIGSCAPRSICGSGLIDAVAVLLDLGIVDATGRFAKTSTLGESISEAITSRVCQVHGEPAFCLARAANGSEPDVFLRAGIKLLQKKVGIEDLDIKQILLAGAFGNYIRRESALRIGLLPAVAAERIRFVGNAASSGAQIILLSSQARQDACELARKTEYVEIAHEPQFQEVFADSMMF
jgi:uncharacterized 2Fe-2S/4Fe-4S cluster protein (DUF4445 family)